MSFGSSRVRSKSGSGEAKKTVKSISKRTTRSRSNLAEILVSTAIIFVLTLLTTLAMVSPKFSLWLGNLLPH